LAVDGILANECLPLRLSSLNRQQWARSTHSSATEAAIQGVCSFNGSNPRDTGHSTERLSRTAMADNLPPSHPNL
jgi:hypothetical protein